MLKKYPWKEKWSSRNKLVASFVRKGSILDIGGGLGEILQFVKPTEYKSIDTEEWTNDTIVANLNVDFPSIKCQFDNVICQGIIEYIIDPVGFLLHIKKYGERMILTYRTGDGKKYPVDRKCFLKQEQMRDTILMCGWEITKVVDSVSILEKVYICKRKKSNDF